MKILVGATGGAGRAVVARLLAEEHEVTAFGRHPERVGLQSDRLGREAGDALSARDVERAVAGHDAVVVTLGISENALRVRLLGPSHTPLDVRSAGTHNVLVAMRRHGVRRLVVLSSYGVGDTRARLGLVDRLFFELILKPQIEDTEKQSRAVSESGLDWVLVQPVHLTDAPMPSRLPRCEETRSCRRYPGGAWRAFSRPPSWAPDTSAGLWRFRVP